VTDTGTTNAIAQPVVKGIRSKAINLTTNKEVERFLKFAVVGGIGFAVDFGTTNLLWSILPRTLELTMPLGIRPISYIGIGGAIGFLAAITSNFLWNRFWTYPDSRTKNIAVQFVMFLAINLMGLVIRTPILELFSQPLATMIEKLLPGIGLDFLSFLGSEASLWVGKNVALMIAVVIAMFWNFFVNRYITYNDVD
jgi:putative flippase GtrA